MRRIFLSIVLSCLLGVGASGASGTLAAQTLSTVVADALAAAGLTPADLALAVIPVSAGQTGLWLNADAPFQPASTMKLVTSIAALDLLGANYRGKTELLVKGRISRGVLHGSIYLRGQADPDLDVPALWQLLYRLREQGVRHIRGNVILDRSFFQPQRTDQGLPPFDESPEWRYNIVPDALHLNGGFLHYVIESSATSIHARTEPRLTGVKVRSEMRFSTADCKSWDDEWEMPGVAVSSRSHRVSITLHGGFPRHCNAEADLQLFDRDLLADRLIRQLWADMGGRISGGITAGVTPEAARVMARHESRPLAEVLRHMNKSSDNALTRLLFLSIGAAATPEFREKYFTTQAAAIARVGEFLAASGIPIDGLVLDNGSGLSRSERISARQLADLLQKTYSTSYAPELLGSLPLAGVDGAMRNRLKNSLAAGRARIKTGGLRNVAAVAGYVADVDQHMYVVVAMINHENARVAKPVLDTIIDWVATHGL
ncbi:MAG: D-alanyl-D-alanine carboxypeptidase/D-alanyl-D-alanine-endopeptidase [Betaproteobacteria bacterium]|nr:D-alanyl-D-alanine carboxypeptidase/D-alanyl-D-alanine-endopeptidase [Betaproteobacteria bacterium]